MEDLIKYSNVVFDAKPDAVPYSYRISYKVSLICLIMRLCGRANVCSLVKLHMISFALISHDNMEKLKEFIDGKNEDPIVRFDPSVNRALTYAIAYGLIEQQQTAKYKLTKRGIQLAEQILLAEDLLILEINDLKMINKKLTESRVAEIIDRWKIKDAEN